MDWESLSSPRNARKAANALAVVIGLAILSVWLECKAEWRLDRIFASLFSFLIVATAVVIRFASRKQFREDGDELWITGFWTIIVKCLARVIQKFTEGRAPSASAKIHRREQLLLPARTTPREGDDR